MRDGASNAVSELSKWGDVMAKVIELCPRSTVPQKVKPVLIEQRGKLVEFPKEQLAAESKTEDQHGEVSSSTVLFFGCF